MAKHPFSNMYLCSVTLGGRTFRCAEAAFQAQKDWSRADEFVPLDGFQARRLGRSVRIVDAATWGTRRVDAMKRVLWAKYTQHPELAEMLIKTGDQTLTHRAEWDSFWGAGRDGAGANMLGQLHMTLRDRLNAELQAAEPNAA